LPKITKNKILEVKVPSPLYSFIGKKSLVKLFSRKRLEEGDRENQARLHQRINTDVTKETT
jgi:hypothetical protein